MNNCPKKNVRGIQDVLIQIFAQGMDDNHIGTHTIYANMNGIRPTYTFLFKIH